METKIIKSFIYSAGGILLAAALMRFATAAGNAQILALPDPMLGIPLRYAVVAVGIIELLVALICLFGKKIGLQTGWLVWLAANFLLYQIGLFWTPCHPQATCLGSLTDPFHLAFGTLGLILRWVPIYLFSGSFIALFCIWFLSKAALPRSQTTPVESLKMSCALCNGHIAFAAKNLGQKIACPHCKATITLMKPKNVKTSCPSCGEHIEFPLHGLGQTIPCPHCKTEVTLQMPA
jgi:hypothetical protein